MLHNISDYKDWDKKVGEHTGWCHFLQSVEWASVQNKNHWKADLTEVEVGDSSYPLAAFYRHAVGAGTVCQIPKIATLSAGQVKQFTEELRNKIRRAVVIKLDIDQSYDQATHQALLSFGWRPVPALQYRETVLLDLTKSREDLLKSFKKRARWELGAGQRRGIKVEKLPVVPENTALLYSLLNETYRRANFVTRKRDFTEDYWQQFAKTGQGTIYIARLENKPLAAAYIINIGERAFYKDGASLRVKPDVFASRVMQWRIIEDLKGEGIKTYDLCGISSNPKSELAGVTLFKTGFGEPVKLQGSYELPLSSWRYKLWKKVVEPVSNKYSLSIRKELWY